MTGSSEMDGLADKMTDGWTHQPPWLFSSSGPPLCLRAPFDNPIPHIPGPKHAPRNKDQHLGLVRGRGKHP